MVVAGVCNKPGLPASVVEISKPIGVSMDRLNDIWRSLRSLPLWVQIWVAGILVPVNVLPFFLLDTRVVNGISLAFDVMDSAKWVAGDRATPGVEVDN